MTSLWTYANPARFLQVTQPVAPWLLGAAGALLAVGLAWGFFGTPPDARQGAAVTNTAASSGIADTSPRPTTTERMSPPAPTRSRYSRTISQKRGSAATTSAPSRPRPPPPWASS